MKINLLKIRNAGVAALARFKNGSGETSPFMRHCRNYLKSPQTLQAFIVTFGNSLAGVFYCGEAEVRENHRSTVGRGDMANNLPQWSKADGPCTFWGPAQTPQQSTLPGRLITALWACLRRQESIGMAGTHPANSATERR